MHSLLPALDRFLEAASVAQKRRALAPVERKAQRELATAFRQQGRLFLAGFKELQSKFQEAALREAVTERDWLAIFERAAAETEDTFFEAIQGAASVAMVRGAENLIADLGVNVAFTLQNPRAVNYLTEHGYGLISNIDAVTRGNIATIVTNAVEEGWSYGRTSTEIRSLYSDMSFKRGKLIAVTEAGMAYEEGNAIVVRDLQDAGLVMEKRWLTVGDDRVSQGCRDNAAEGWIPVAASFSSGHMQPLRFPGCRCTTQYRRKPTN